MVARAAFVEVERLHAPEAARRQVVGVEVEDAGARAVGRALLVGAAGLELLAERLVRPDLERGLGDGRELLADPRVDRLADPVIAFGQRLLARRLELRVGAQMLEELRQRALEADLRALISSIPLLIRATSLRPSIVDLVGGQRQRRRALDHGADRAWSPPFMYMRPTPSRALGRYSVLQEVAQAGGAGIDLVRRSTAR